MKITWNSNCSVHKVLLELSYTNSSRYSYLPATTAELSTVVATDIIWPFTVKVCQPPHYPQKTNWPISAVKCYEGTKTGCFVSKRHGGRYFIKDDGESCFLSSDIRAENGMPIWCRGRVCQEKGLAEANALRQKWMNKWKPGIFKCNGRGRKQCNSESDWQQMPDCPGRPLDFRKALWISFLGQQETEKEF